MSDGKSGLLLPTSVLEDPGGVDLTANQERVCRDFAAFLRQYRTTAGDILLELAQGPWTEAEMRELEDQIRHRGADERQMIDYLRVLRKLAGCWMMRHELTAPMPRQVVPVPALENPSRMDPAKAFRYYRAWATWLIHQIDAAGPPRKHAALPAIESVVPLLASAIMYGGLWNESAIVTLVRTIPRLLYSTMATADAIYIGLTLRWGDTPLGEFRCWQPDALTAILLLRTPEAVVRDLLAQDPSSKSEFVSDTIIFDRIKAKFQRVRAQFADAQLCSLLLLLKSTQCIGSLCMPSVIARYATRKVMSSSLSLEQIRRISGKEWLFGLPLRPAAEEASIPEDVLSDVLEDVPPWGRLMEAAILKKDRTVSGAELDALAQFSELTPLAVRLVDFARKAIVVPAIVRGEMSYAVFARRVLILATLMHRQWPDIDPAQLRDDQLECGYRRLADGARDADPSGEALREVTHVLKQFHTYMRNCHGKDRLKDTKLLLPKSLLDRVDVDLITFSEYRRLRRDIDLKWPGNRNEARRQAAHALAIFGFRWGTRREEARLCRIGDLLVDTNVDLLVRASKEHTLKSPAAKRRLPGLCLESDEQKFLRSLRETRLQHCTEEAHLCGDALEEPSPVPPSIFRSLNQILAQITGTSESQYPTHYHHLRHAFACYILLLLLLPPDSLPPSYLRKEDIDWLIAGANSRPDELRRRSQAWGGDVALVSQLLGHLHPATTMIRYFHFSAELLRIYLERSPWLRPSPVALAAAMGRKPEAQQPEESSAMRYAIALLGKKAQSDVPRPNQAKHSKLPMASPFSQRLEQVLSFLRYMQTPEGPIEAATEFFGWDENRAKSVVRVAAQLSTMLTGNGAFRHRFRMSDAESGECVRSIEPTWPADPTELQLFRKYAVRIEILTRGKESRQALMRGLEAYVNNVWHSSHFPVFRDPDADGNQAVAFHCMLKSLKIRRKDIRFGSYDTKGSPSRSKWKDVLRLDRVKFLRREAPGGGPNATQPWISIEPILGSDAQTKIGSFGFRCLLTLSFIAISAQ